jgi:hypothetical protein
MRARALLLFLPLFVVACGTSGSIERPVYPDELRADISNADGPLSFQEDYWTASFGPYLSPDVLQGYWLESEERRFESFGERWLEFSLREDLMRDRLSALTPEEIERIRSQPDFDSSKQVLDALPGSKSE